MFKKQVRALSTVGFTIIDLYIIIQGVVDFSNIKTDLQNISL